MKVFSKVWAISLIVLVGIIGLASFKPHEDNRYFEIAKNIEIFTNLYKEINTHYVDQVDPGKLMRTGIDAMLESLDPFTNYISESEIESYRFITEGKYHGIGAQIREIDGQITITTPYQNSPASDAGMKAGDIILEIDGKSTEGKSADDVINILQGFPGTEIAFTIRRPGESKDIKLTMTRGEVSVPNVPYSGIVGDNIAYVALTTFTRNAGDNVAKALKDLKQEHPDLKGMILDLRGNGGGLLGEAVNVSNVFIPNGEVVVSTRGKIKERDRSYSTRQSPVDTELPLTVLINKSSASASEIVSGVIQDLDRGVLIGQRSYGKGLVQNTRDIGYNAKLKITTAKYYIPSGRCIQSVSYDDGEPVDIPDEQRARFKTRSGRTVLDGGGVKPDIVLKSATDVPLIKQLIDQHLIFHYATQYALEHESIPAPQEYTFADWDDFVAFVKSKDFHYQSKLEAQIQKLETLAEEKGVKDKVASEIAALKDRLYHNVEEDLAQYKNTIINLLEKEIVGRYYYRKGQIQAGLNRDVEVVEAMKLINDEGAYATLLK